MPVDSLAAVDGHFLFKVVKMSNLTRREKLAYAIIAKLEYERDALKAQLAHGEAAGWFWYTKPEFKQQELDGFELDDDFETPQSWKTFGELYTAPLANPVSDHIEQPLVMVDVCEGFNTWMAIKGLQEGLAKSAANIFHAGAEWQARAMLNPPAKPVSDDEYKAIIEVGYKLDYEAAICDTAKAFQPEASQSL